MPRRSTKARQDEIYELLRWGTPLGSVVLHPSSHNYWRNLDSAAGYVIPADLILHQSYVFAIGLEFPLEPSICRSK